MARARTLTHAIIAAPAQAPTLRLVTDDDEDALRLLARIDAKNRVWLLLWDFKKAP